MKASRKQSGGQGTSRRRSSPEAESQSGGSLPSLSETRSTPAQLDQTVWVPEGTPPEQAERLKASSKALFASLETTGSEDALGQILVGMTNVVMGAMGRAAQNACSPGAREVETRTVIKGALAICEIIKTLDKHRSRGGRVIRREIAFASDGRNILKAFAAAHGHTEPIPTVSTEEAIRDEE